MVYDSKEKRYLVYIYVVWIWIDLSKGWSMMLWLRKGMLDGMSSRCVCMREEEGGRL